ncbi:F0F1-type ATP synthase assembly protein I [Saccharothrix coeruleofusca]|uniref:hypothetical protein n=1 Tax=Saccharothrix coeruleofusca TaxID=33919 RepID=UPI001AE63E4D|nr:hypothetical protein [Saccharothrix coeruleofusca]MBP2335099.1 F0F1-type ATP synthase assembly protein I [Saccharothrix coeruleofusca]
MAENVQGLDLTPGFGKDTEFWDGFSGAGMVDTVAGLVKSIRENNTAAIAAYGVGLGFDVVGAALNPLGAVIGAGVGWLIDHIFFLREPLDLLMGDNIAVRLETDKIKKDAEKYQAIATTHVEALKKLDPWTGETAQRFKDSMIKVADEIQAIALGVHGAAEIMATMGACVTAFRSLVRDIIAMVVGNLIGGAITAAGLAPFTFGASIVAFVGVAVATAMEALGRIMRHIANLKSLLTANKNATQQISRQLDEVVDGAGRLNRSGSSGGAPTPPPVNSSVTPPPVVKPPDPTPTPPPGGATSTSGNPVAPPPVVKPPDPTPTPPPGGATSTSGNPVAPPPVVKPPDPTPTPPPGGATSTSGAPVAPPPVVKPPDPAPTPPPGGATSTSGAPVAPPPVVKPPDPAPTPPPGGATSTSGAPVAPPPVVKPPDPAPTPPPGGTTSTSGNPVAPPPVVKPPDPTPTPPPGGTTSTSGNPVTPPPPVRPPTPTPAPGGNTTPTPAPGGTTPHPTPNPGGPKPGTSAWQRINDIANKIKEGHPQGLQQFQKFSKDKLEQTLITKHGKTPQEAAEITRWIKNVEELAAPGGGFTTSSGKVVASGSLLHLAHELWKELASDEYAKNQGGLSDENRDGNFDRDEKGELKRDPTSEEYLKDLKEFNKNH